MNAQPICSTCGQPLPADAPSGICPQCLLNAGFESHAAPPADLAATAASPNKTGFAPPAIGDLASPFPQLEILELLGQGGMGAVYKARQRGLDRLVAVKILPPEISRDPAFAERFVREARALGKLNHPNIVAVHDSGQTTDGLCYFVMEFVDGVNLRQAIRAGNMTPKDALAIVPQICEALQFAHDAGIVHRDIKPENVLVDKQGRVKIADFGLAKLLGTDGAQHTLTATQQVMGTLKYMAPEQLVGTRDVDHRADIFSLGVVFYELLTGELPVGRFAPPSQKVQIDVRLDEVVLRALEQSPEQRYQHASEVKTNVEAIVRSSRYEPATGREITETNAHAPRWALGAAVLVTALLVIHIGTFTGLFLDSVRGFDGRLVEVGKSWGFGSTTESVQVVILAIGALCLGLATSPWVFWLYRGSLSTADVITDNRERAKSLIRGPAIGLMMMGLVNFPMLFLAFIVVHGAHFFGDKPFRFLDGAALLGYFYFIRIALGAIHGGQKMLDLESHGDALNTARTSLYWPTLNLFVFAPISLWALTILGRRDVRDAFTRLEATDEDRLADPQPMPTTPSPTPPQASLPPLLGVAFGLILGALCVTVGLLLVPAAFVFSAAGSGPFWGWMGAAIGCLGGGLGSVAGSWNTYRQLRGEIDWLKSPRWTPLDFGLLAYGSVGLFFLLILPPLIFGVLKSAESDWLPATVYGTRLLGGLLVFQAALFLIFRIPVLLESAHTNAAPRATSVRRSIKFVLWMVSLFAIVVFLSFNMRASRTADTDQLIVNVGAMEPWLTLTRTTRHPNSTATFGTNSNTSINALTWSFFGIGLAYVLLVIGWRMEREDAGKKPFDANWWRTVLIRDGLFLAFFFLVVLLATTWRGIHANATVPATTRTVVGPVTYLDGHSSIVRAVAVSPDGRSLVSTGLDGRVIVRDLPSGNVRHIVRTNDADPSQPAPQLLDVAITPNNMYALASGNPNTGILRIRLDKSLTETLGVKSNGSIKRLVSYDGGHKLALVRGDSEFVLLNLADQTEIAASPIFPGKFFGNVRSSAADPDGSFVAVTSSNMVPGKDGAFESAEPCQLTVFDTINGREQLSWQFADYADFSFAHVVYPDPRSLVVCLPSGQMRRWTLDASDKWTANPETVRIAPGRYTAACASRDGNLIWLAHERQVTGVSATTGKGVAWADLEIGARREAYSAFPIESLAATAEPLTVAAALWDGRVALVKASALEPEAKP